jgi:chromate transport protein ChrA
MKVRLFDWVWLNLKIGVLSFGGTSRIMMFLDATVHEYKWITQDQFTEYLTVAQVLPGPNLINMSVYLGYRLCGTLGAILGLIGLSAPGAIAAVVFVAYVPLDQPDIRELVRGVSIGSVALMAVFLWNLATGLTRTHLPNINARVRKIALRACVVAGVAALSFAHQPAAVTIISGAALGLAVEFCI